MKGIDPKTRKNLMQRLRRIAKMVKGVDSKQPDKKLFDLGFHYEGRKRCTCGGLYIHKKLKVIVKFPFLFEANPPRSKNMLPTIVRGDGLVIQPFVNTKNSSKAYNLLKQDRKLRDLDLHDGNTGWFNRVPVLIDW